MDRDPLGMPQAIAQASGAWVRMSLGTLKHGRAGVMVETTLAHPSANLASLEAFKAAGYKTRLDVLAVPALVSLASVMSRYVWQVYIEGAGRWVDPFH